ncbi:MAG: Zn-ribbon domain-containing OB-fold protein [Acetobacteraceae bacterium]|nr:Zn-ribbon domain-containing OB-fold protein [Acetobacteraceae bacterium]
MTDQILPAPTPDSLPYWEGLRDGRLLLQRCAGCGVIRHYPRPVCAACFSTAVTWIEASGHGTVHSWTETHHAFLPSFSAALPYTLVTADLAEGGRLLARLVGSPAGLRIGAAVRCRFEPLGDWAVPVLELVAAQT